MGAQGASHSRRTPTHGTVFVAATSPPTGALLPVSTGVPPPHAAAAAVA